MTDKNSTWEEHREELIGFCIYARISLQELADAAYHRMPELTDHQRSDLLRRAKNFLPNLT